VQMCLSSYVISMSEVHVFVLVKWMEKVLSKLKESRLALNHLF